MSTDASNPVSEPAPQMLPPQLQFDDSKVTTSYANFCRISGTTEEVILDFGLNPQPVGFPTQPIVVSDRVVTSFITAKRMLMALQTTIERHEQAFGVIEVEVQKRLINR